MFTRLLGKPSRSILLIGPRGTGKSTWIGAHFREADFDGVRVLPWLEFLKRLWGGEILR